MFLRRLELWGFKSFPERTELEFTPGLTAIVGPNGSGKSNLADAVRWALGEQSARALRGSRMDEVIFSGTDRRKALAAAEVRLTFDNQDGVLPVDFAEVTVARRVTRDGEGSYYLNGAPCRLKDLVDLFADTGIGRDSYSLVSQGRIGAILSAGGEERRELLEEAAGVTRYRLRRRETLRRLEACRQDTERLQVVLAELEGQLGPLEDQARMARAYRELSLRLQALEVGVLLYAIAHMQARVERGHTRRRELGDALAADERRAAQLGVELEGARGAVAQAGAAAAAHRGALAEARAAAREESARQESSQEALAELDRQVADSVRAARERRELVETLSEELESVAREAARVEAEAELARAELTARAAELARCRDQGSRALDSAGQTKAEAIEALNRAAGARNRLSALEVELGQARAQLQRWVTERERLTGAQEEVVARSRRLVTEGDEVRARLEAGRRELAAAVADVDRAEVALRQVRRELDRVTGLVAARQSRLGVLREMLSGYEGFARGPRAVLTAGAELSGVVGAVAELVVPKTGYERAVAAALGGASQYIITESEDHAKACIEYLKRSDGGRATFLPLSLVRPQRLSVSEQRAVSGVEGALSALEVVEFEPRLSAAVAHLLGRVVVTRDLDAALAVGRATGLRLRVATTGGELVAPGGVLSGGGRAPEGVSLLGRRREAGELERTLVALGREQDAQRAELRRLEEGLAGARRRADEWQREVSRLEALAGALHREQEAVAAETARLEKAAASCSLEVQRAGERVDNAVQQRARLEAALARAEAEATRWREEAEVREREQAELRALVERAQEAHTAVRVRVAELEAKLGSIAEERERIGSRLQSARAELAGARATVSRHAHRRHLLRRQLAGGEAAARKRAADCTRLEAELGRSETELEAAGSRVELLESELAALERLRAGRRQRLHAEEVEEARVEVELEHLLAELSNRHGLTPVSAAEGYRPLEPAVVAGDIEDLRRRLAEFGAVNLAAIDDHQRVSQRYLQLKTQYEDIESATRDLERAIAESDRQMAAMFDATFTAVRESFRQVFRRLFGGGSADLVLDTPERPLEAGVEIVAQPPGRRLRSLSLLSGGEKAMTALALLFAVLSVKPSPFCLLDEVEAALDEANAQRFIGLLRDFSERAQLVVITHQKATMEAADVLYGVTMEEPGVSRLVSVRLADAAASG